jgi:hypothetical protein
MMLAAPKAVHLSTRFPMHDLIHAPARQQRATCHLLHGIVTSV